MAIHINGYHRIVFCNLEAIELHQRRCIYDIITFACGEHSSHSN